jgi:hypothetical protein
MTAGDSRLQFVVYPDTLLTVRIEEAPMTGYRQAAARAGRWVVH